MKISIAKASDRSHCTQFFTELDNTKPLDLCKYQWSPIIWKGGRRLELEFLCSTALVLDFDDGQWDLAAAEKWIHSLHLAAIVGTTKSHQVEKNGQTVDRFRIVVPWTRPIDDVRAHRQNMIKVLRTVPADKACVDGARSYRPFREIVGMHTGKTLAWDKYLAPKQRPVYIRSSIPEWIIDILTNGAAPGQRNGACFRIAANLVKCALRDDEIEAMIISSNIDLPTREKLDAARSGIRAGRAKYGSGVQYLGSDR